MASVIGFSAGASRRRSANTNAQSAWGAAPAVDRLIVSEVLPRLLVAHSAGPRVDDPPIPQCGPDEVERIAALALHVEAHALLSEVESFLRRGLTAEQIFVRLLAPAARHLGEQWKQDRLDFVDVTMGLWRLQEVLRELAARTPPIIHGLRDPRSALFSPFPGEQHSFGTAMIDECFARAGWKTQLMIDPGRGELLARVANQSFDLIGLTVSCDSHIGALSPLIVAVRNVSKNPDLCVMLGGRVLIENPHLADMVGADGTAATALDALDVAEQLVAIPLQAAIA